MMRTDADKENLDQEEGIVSRWSRLKSNARKQDQAEEAHDTQNPDEPPREQAVLTDADMPPIESLTEESDFSVFLSPQVSDKLRNMALRKLFHTSEFNVCDGLDDYDDDYTQFAKLGDIVTSDMKHQMQVEASKLLALNQDEIPDAAISQDDHAVQSITEGDDHGSDSGSNEQNQISEPGSEQDLPGTTDLESGNQ